MSAVMQAEELLAAGEAVVLPRLEGLEVGPEGLVVAYLKARMEELSLTIPHLMGDGGFPRQYYHRILKGMKPLSTSVIRAIDQNTDISAAELFFVRALHQMSESD